MRSWQFTPQTEPPTCAADTSLTLMTALRHATGPHLWRVDIVGDEIKVLWSFDATDMLRRFMRKCALDVIHLWDAPDVVVRFLKTGDESLREAANVATRDARDAWSAMDAAWYAGRSADWAAWSGTGDDVWFTAHAVAKFAVRAAARAAMTAAFASAFDAALHAAQAKQNRSLTSMVLNEAERLGVY